MVERVGPFARNGRRIRGFMRSAVIALPLATFFAVRVASDVSRDLPKADHMRLEDGPFKGRSVRPYGPFDVACSSRVSLSIVVDSIRSERCECRSYSPQMCRLKIPQF